MDFLNEVYFGNTIKSYVAVAITILGVLLFRKILSHSIATLLYRFVKKTWSTINKENFVSLTVKPLGWFLAVSVAVFAIDKLNFPGEFNFRIYHHSFNEILQKVGVVFIILSFIRLVLRLIDFIALILHEKASHTNTRSDDQLVTFFRDFLKVFINIICLFLIIKVAFNQNVGTLLTGLSIVGAALALAAKESLENLIASFIIFFDKPFFTGDTLKVNNVLGRVERIGLRSTRIRTTDKTLVTVPNKQMVDSIVDNLSLRNQRRAEIKIEMSEKTPLEDAQAFIEAVKKMMDKKKDSIESFTIFLSDYNKNGITATLEFFTGHITMDDFSMVKQLVNIELIKLRTALNVEFPASSPSVNIFNSETDAGAPRNNNSII
ncbi:MAG: mechanosensitive ion channel domain-containing protein [Ferruginibacter sp.]